MSTISHESPAAVPERQHSSAELESAIPVALFAWFATIAVGKYGFRRQRTVAD